MYDYRASVEARSLDFFISDFMRENLDINPPYPRGAVWGTRRKQNLIRSLMAGIPIAAVILNDRAVRFEGHDAASDPFYAVVDGKQRITAIQEFADGKFEVPGEWFGRTALPTGPVGISTL